jgi:hypothetical protein
MDLSCCFLQLGKQVPENGITVNKIGRPDQVTGWVETPGYLIGHNWAVHQLGWHPFWVD